MSTNVLGVGCVCLLGLQLAVQLPAVQSFSAAPAGVHGVQPGKTCHMGTSLSDAVLGSSVGATAGFIYYFDNYIMGNTDPNKYWGMQANGEPYMKTLVTTFAMADIPRLCASLFFEAEKAGGFKLCGSKFTLYYDRDVPATLGKQHRTELSEAQAYVKAHPNGAPFLIGSPSSAHPGEQYRDAAGYGIEQKLEEYDSTIEEFGPGAQEADQTTDAAWRTADGGYYQKLSGTVVRTGTINCKKILKLNTADGTWIRDHADNRPGVPAGSTYGMPTFKQSNDVLAALDLCSSSCMLDDSNTCCRVPHVVASYFPCCWQLNCCPAQLTSHAGRRRNLRTAVSSNVEQSASSKSVYTQLRDCLNKGGTVDSCAASHKHRKLQHQN